MITPPPNPAEREERLDSIVTAYFQAVDAGQAPDPDDWIAGHPDLAEELHRFFRGHHRVDHLAEPLRPVTRAARVDALDTEILDRTPSESGSADSSPDVGSFQDYEILEPIGEGGMGVIYKARHKELGRFVALKLLLAGRFATPRDLQRFRNETEMVASLDHPNIVPIYEVGTFARRPYFSMRLMEGGSLAQHLDQFRTDLRAAALLVATIARAVHHAHLRGILHRDLKPSNILLDAAGGPYVTDFGLAKRLEGDQSLTDTGVIVGMPTYMAPERVLGKHGAITTATDVYGLGTILYALLTGRPPFAGETPLDTLAQVKECEPATPSSLNELVDRDLQTICLKCLEKDAARRYGSAEELAQELDRWRAGEPIQARPIPRIARLVRWCRRRPAAAALLFLVALLLAASILGPSVVAYYLVLARNDEAAARASAEDSSQDAIAAVQTFFDQVSDSDELSSQAAEQLRRNLSGKAAEFYKRFIDKHGEDPRLRLALGLAYVRLGSITADIGSIEQAIQYEQQAVAILEQLIADQPEAPQPRLALAQCYRELGPMFRQVSRQTEAGDALAQAATLLEALAREYPAEASYRQRLAVVLTLSAARIPSRPSLLMLGQWIWASCWFGITPGSWPTSTRWPRVLAAWRVSTRIQADASKPEPRCAGSSPSRISWLNKIQMLPNISLTVA
jgi:serine/threonine protein kinase